MRQNIYNTAVRRYEFYFRVVKTNILRTNAERMSKILSSHREDKIRIFKPPCNVLFIIYIVVNNLRPKSVTLIFDQ